MFGKGHDYKGCRISPMQTVMLLLLLERPMYGYEVLKEMRDRFESVWTPQTGSIYPALKRLAERGLVASEQRDGTDYYTLTAEGREWVVDKLKHAPRDVRMLIRFLDILDQAARTMDLPEGEREPGRFAEGFEDDNPDLAKKAERLRKAREHIAQHLAEVDRALKEIEESERNGGMIQ